MKRIVIGLLTVGSLVCAVQAELLLGFDQWANPFSNQGNSASFVGTDVSGSMTYSGGTNSASEWFNGDSGSNDGTFGPSLTGADNTGTTAFLGGLATKGVNDQSAFAVFVTINNDHATDNLVINNFVFDTWREFAGSPPRWDLYGSGDITSGFLKQTAFISNLGAPATANANDYTDLSMNLGNIGDNVLAAGESATFELRVWESTSSINQVGKSWIDNVGIDGVFQAVPEPATLGLIVMFGGGLVVARRFFTI
ncbi:hypothetical protein [Pontiella sulfatireligans]|uniref:PEP-CTERM protein-sorting domain-containing protein n=1 Tax=Pontiella sulfatireligans TaxID=2750658 RepID=A0A6C2USI0_9BACT|nr:hypothetical protein [Pontiella sulfatireligans]VGO21876.1 hypothetical protein SCARR_03956 [Pontiella sulfatireligans]